MKMACGLKFGKHYHHKKSQMKKDYYKKKKDILSLPPLKN